jgi:hypothetical protein
VRAGLRAVHTEWGTAVMTTRPIRAFSRRNRTERVRRYAADLAPSIKNIQEAGITSPAAIAVELNRLGIPVAAGLSDWRPAQVAWVLHHLRWRGESRTRALSILVLMRWLARRAAKQVGRTLMCGLPR